MPVKDENKFKALEVFANVTRRKIFLTIAKQGAMSFTALRDELNLTDGRLYFHVKKLDSFITKDEQKFYKLNSKGKEIYNRLFAGVKTYTQSTSIDQEKSTDADSSILSRVDVTADHHIELKDDMEIGFLTSLAPSNLFYFLLGTKTRTTIELSLLAIVVCWLFGVTHSYFSLIETLFVGGAITNIIVSFMHWLVYYGIIVFSLTILGKKPKFHDLFIVLLIGIMPYSIFLIPKALFYFLTLSIPVWGDLLLTILFIFCKTWSVLLIAQGIVITANARPHQAIIISSLLILLDYGYVLFLL